MIVNILAAGRGSRVNELTKDYPKALIKYKGKRLIEWSLDAIEEVFFREDVWIVTGYKANLLASYSDNLIHNFNWEKFNIGSSINEVFRKHKNKDCLFIYSDIYFEKQIIAEISNSNESSIVSVENWKKIWNLRFDKPQLDLESYIVDINNHVIGIGVKNPSVNSIHGQFAGIFYIKRNDWKRFRSLSKITDEQINLKDSTQLLSNMIECGIKFRNIKYTGEWAEIDTFSDLKRLEKVTE